MYLRRETLNYSRFSDALHLKPIGCAASWPTLYITYEKCHLKTTKDASCYLFPNVYAQVPRLTENGYAFLSNRAFPPLIC
jgi:hypothetical protein